MKHILGINELFKKTYLSAANKLRTLKHNKKADELELWGMRRGINEPFPLKEDPNRFYFNNITDLKGKFYDECFSKLSPSKHDELGPFSPPPPFFHIIGFKLGPCWGGRYLTKSPLVLGFNFKVNMVNNYGDKININVQINLSMPDEKKIFVNKDMNPRIFLTMEDNKGEDNKRTKDFKFQNRKDATKFKNFLVEIIPDLKELSLKPPFYNQEWYCPTDIVNHRDELIETYRNIKDKDGNPILGKVGIQIPFDIIKEISVNKFYEAS